MADKKRRPKQPRLDANQRAHRLVELVTGDKDDKEPKEADQREEKPAPREGNRD